MGSPAREEFEFFPPGVLLITAVLFVALWQLSGGPTNVIARSPTPISPFSLVALSKGVSATLRAIQLASLSGGSSFTAKLFAGFFPISYLGFSWLPRVLGGSEISPLQIGMRSIDLLSSTVFPTPTFGYLCRMVFHSFYVCPLADAPLTSLFYWLAIIPGCFYLTFTLLDGAFIGSRSSATPAPSSPLSQLVSNLVTVAIAQLFCVSTALHFSRLFPIFQLPTPNVFYGPEPLLFALFIVVMYRNPTVYPIALSDPSLQLPFPIETRWVLSVVLTLLLAITPWRNVTVILISGGFAGGMLILKEWVQQQHHQIGNFNQRQKFQYFVLTIELSLYYVSFFFLPLSTSSTPSLKNLSYLTPSNIVNLFHSELPSLWVILCSTDLTARFLAKILAVYLPLIPFIPPSGFASSCRSMSILFLLQLFYGMNSRVWMFPHIGFIIHAIGAYRLFSIIPSLKM